MYMLRKRTDYEKDLAKNFPKGQGKGLIKRTQPVGYLVSKVRRPQLLTFRSAFSNFRFEIISRRLCLSASSTTKRHAWAEARNRMAKLQIRSAYIDTFAQCILYKKTYARFRRKQTFHIRLGAFNSKKKVCTYDIRVGVFLKLIALKAFPPPPGERYHQRQQKQRWWLAGSSSALPCQK